MKTPGIWRWCLAAGLLPVSVAGLVFFGGGGLFGMLMLGVLLFIVFRSSSRRAMANSATTGGSFDDGMTKRDDSTITIAQVQIGILASARKLRQDLHQLAATAPTDTDTDTDTGTHDLLQNVILALLHNSEYWVYGHGEAAQVGVHGVEATFNRLSMTERSKLGSKTTPDGAGQDSHGDGDYPAAASGYIAVTLLVASRSSIQIPKLATADNLRTTLLLLGSIPAGDLLTMEVIWQPAGNGNMLTSTELVTLYPKLQTL